jgi:hypothetical protein
VVQANKGVNILTLNYSDHLNGLLKSQLFHDLATAKDRLRNCQRRAGAVKEATQLPKNE